MGVDPLCVAMVPVISWYPQNLLILTYTSYLCLQTLEKTAFESLSRDFSSFKNVVVSLTNLCQGQLKISRENAKLPRKPRNQKRKKPLKTFSDFIPLASTLATICVEMPNWSLINQNTYMGNALSYHSIYIKKYTMVSIGTHLCYVVLRNT